MQRHVPAQAALQLRNRVLDLLGDRERVEGGLFVDHQEHARLTVDRGVSDLVFGPQTHVGHVGQRDGHTVLVDYRRRPQIGRRFDPRPLSDGQSLVGRFQEAGPAEPRGPLRRHHHLIQRKVMLPKPPGIDQHLVLLDLAAEDLDPRHAGHRLQSPGESPIGQSPQVPGRRLRGRQAHDQ